MNRSVNWDGDARQAVLAGRDILERTGQSLARSQRTAAETEEMGTTVVAELGEQREALLRSKQRLSETNEGLSRSRAVLRKMVCHVVTNKLILVAIVLLELFILAAVVYLKFFSKKK
ncbi:vesicle transport through interaction with t-SNAREs homolog 1B isoform X1 [Bacillus rossius redtenbacheri]